jgi:hypothetical protein
MEFQACHIKTLVANAATKLPVVFPTLDSVLTGTGSQGLLTGQDALNWVKAHSVQAGEDISAKGEHLKLLEKLCRVMIRQYWIRTNFDDHGSKLLAMPQWKALGNVLEKTGLLKVRKNVAVGGPKSDFYRIERAREFLDPDCVDALIVSTRKAVLALK